MRPLNADFKSQRQLSATWGGMILSVLLLACAGQAALAIHASQQAEFARAKASALRDSTKWPPVRRIELRPYADDAAQAVRTATFDWVRALGPVVNARVEGVAATALSIDAQGNTGALVVEALTADNLHAYESALIAGEPNGRWRLRQWAAMRGPGLTATFEFSRTAAPAPLPQSR